MNNFKPLFLTFIVFICQNAPSIQIEYTAQDHAEELIKEMEFKEGTEVEAKYLLPPVNVSNSDGERVVTSSLSRVLNFYNTEFLAAKWENTRQKISSDCRRDVEKYIEGLNKAENWALKMDDASGRYSTGWFWGNHYWIGSQTQCENIAPKRQIIIETQNHSRVARSTKIKNAIATQALGYKHGAMEYTSLPPFPIAFFILRIHLNSSFTTEEKVLHVGLCMPYICTDDDLQYILEETSKASSKVTVQVEAVRSHHDSYVIWQDGTFITLCVVTCLVTLLLFVGTCYDFYLEHLRKKIKMLSLKNSYNNEMMNSSMKIDNSMPDMKDNNHGFIFKEFLMSFSVRQNIKSICDQSVGSDTIPVIHGLKSISMAWVILGHTCIVAFRYSDNMEFRKVIQREFLFQTIANGAFSVDTFFFASGLLVSFLYFRTNAKGKLDPLTGGRSGFFAGLLHFLGLIGYRFARLTAPYLFTLGVVEVSMKWFNYNSIFEPPAMDHENCPNYWWRNVLYINTLFPVEEMCMLWSWYLSDDTQFYVVGAIMLILSTSHFKSAAALLLTFMFSSWITTGYIAYSNRHMPGADDPLALFDKIYDKPWTRLGPYLIGMCIGWLLFKKDCSIRFPKWALVLGWVLSMSCLLSLVYGLYEVNLPAVIGAAYSSLSHSAWALSLSWVVIACATGHGGFVNSILSSTILYPFSRITYCAYLIHPIVIRVMAMSMDSPLHLGTIVMIIIFLGQVVASYAIAFCVSVAFEAPMVSLLRIISKIGARMNRTDTPPPPPSTIVTSS